MTPAATDMTNVPLPLNQQLHREILMARERVYRFGQPTPMERLILPGPEPHLGQTGGPLRGQVV